MLTPALADGLAVYEKQPESLRNYFPDLLGLIDLEHEDRRLQKVAVRQGSNRSQGQGRSASARARVERIRPEPGRRPRIFTPAGI